MLAKLCAILCSCAVFHAEQQSSKNWEKQIFFSFLSFSFVFATSCKSFLSTKSLISIKTFWMNTHRNSGSVRFLYSCCHHCNLAPPCSALNDVANFSQVWLATCEPYPETLRAPPARMFLPSLPWSPSTYPRPRTPCQPPWGHHPLPQQCHSSAGLQLPTALLWAPPRQSTLKPVSQPSLVPSLYPGLRCPSAPWLPCSCLSDPVPMDLRELP